MAFRQERPKTVVFWKRAEETLFSVFLTLLLRKALGEAHSGIQQKTAETAEKQKTDTFLVAFRDFLPAQRQLSLPFHVSKSVFSFLKDEKERKSVSFLSNP